MKHEALLQEFIERFGLQETMKGPLEELFQSWLEQMAQTLDPALEAALAQKASWQPVSLSESGSDAPKQAKRAEPTTKPVPAMLPPKPIALEDDDDPIIYATLDAPTDKFPALDMSQTMEGEGLSPNDKDAFISRADNTQMRNHDLRTERFDTSETSASPAPYWPPQAPDTEPYKTPEESFAYAETAVLSVEELNANGLPTEVLPTLPPSPEFFTGHPMPLPTSSNPPLEAPLPHENDEPPQKMLAANVSHYTRLSKIAVGGMSEILRVQDRDLNRVVAMKVIKPSHEEDPILLSRFLEEAQVTAQLEHPGIVPVHEFGRLADGRFYFTMKEIKGTSMTEVIRQVHEATRGDTWGTTKDGWHLWRLLDGFRRVCEAVNFAHSHRVIHRDLKPDNIVVGRHGEVLVVDWGLVKLLPPEGESERQEQSLNIAASEEIPPKQLTMAGDLIGTPTYMPPEQLTSPNKANERNDVYSLGAILYEILAGQSPYVGYNKNAIVFQLMSGPPYPPGRVEPIATPYPEPEEEHAEALAEKANKKPTWNTSGELPSHATDKPYIPDGLIEICAKAMSRDPDERYPNAGELARVMGDWLTGSKDRRRALQVVAEAEDRFPETWLLRTRARQLRKEAERKSRAVEPWDPEEQKWPIWELEEQAAGLQRQARQLELETEQLLKGALTHFPDLEEAHEALVIRYQKAHQRAEEGDDKDDIARQEMQLREHLQALPLTNPRRTEIINYLQGDGALTLLTDPPGARVQLFRLDEERRRLQEQHVKDLGTTPIKKHILPMGSYLLKIKADGYQEVRYPLHIRRGEHWRSTHPITKQTHRLRLPPQDSLTRNECLIPAGMSWIGGDPNLPDALTGQRVWLDDYVIQRYPVTNAEYQEFLRALLGQRRGDLVALFAPQDNSLYSSDETALFAGGDAHQPQATKKDIAKIAAPPDWPVIKVSWFGAMAYAQWLSGLTGHQWRLPFELEWEKAARGVDRRLYPWGHYLDPSWTHVRASLQGEHTPTSVERYPVDVSVYGVRGTAGNVMDWCLDTYSREGPPIVNRTFQRDKAWEQSMPHDITITPEHIRRIRRGGAWSSTGQAIRSTYRHWSDPNATYSAVGFRLARNYE